MAGGGINRGVTENQLVALPERDLELLLLLGKLRYLSTSQLERLFFPGLPASRKSRLHDLRQRNLLDMVQKKTGPGDRYPAVWFLGALGRRVVAELEGRRPVAGPLGLLFWPHYLMVSEFYVTLVEAQRRGRLGSFIWTAPPDTRVSFRGFSGRVGVNTFEPDAHLALAAGANTLSFLLEMDRGTMAAGAMRLKIRRFAEWFADSPRAERLLFLIPDEHRRTQIQGWLAEARLTGLVYTPAEALEYFLGLSHGGSGPELSQQR